MDSKPIIQRAVELASSGNFGSVDAVRRQLRAERYTRVEVHLGGKFTITQLRALIAKAQGGS